MATESDFSESAPLVGHTREKPDRGSRDVFRLGITVLVVGGLLTIALCVAASLRAGRESDPLLHDRSEFVAKDMLQSKFSESRLDDNQSQCGKFDEGVEYQVEGGWYLSLDHVPNPDMCCAMCQGVSQCKSFTWVKDAGLDGCPSQCWLKGGRPSWTKKKSGVVSGLPPGRPEWTAALDQSRTSVGHPSTQMFCFALVVPGSYEESLIKFQHGAHVSMFACDDWKVYSNKTLDLGDGLRTSVVDVDLSVKFGGDSYTALNSWIFIAVWKKVIDDGWHRKYDFLIKVDPDAVFFANRIRPILDKHADVGYINNCKYGLHGPIEVLSAGAVKALENDYSISFDGKAPKTCVEKLKFGEWGEDFFLSRCLTTVLNVTRALEPKLMCEAHCDCSAWYWCQSADMVTFHPFKRVDMYKQCMANSIAQESSMRRV